MVKMIEWVGIYIGDVNQNGAFRENESGKGTFGRKYGILGKNRAFHLKKQKKIHFMLK